MPWLPGKTLLKHVRNNTSSHARRPEDSVTICSFMLTYCSWQRELRAINLNELYFCPLKGQVNLSGNMVNAIIAVRGLTHWFWHEISHLSVSCTPRKWLSPKSWESTLCVHGGVAELCCWQVAGQRGVGHRERTGDRRMGREGEKLVRGNACWGCFW